MLSPSYRRAEGVQERSYVALMSPGIDFHIRAASWTLEADDLLAIRTTVFVEEQGVPAELERDGLDVTCRHAIAIHRGRPVGTGRITSSGHIGRVAVLAAYRRQGIGKALIGFLIEISDASEIDLHAQVHARTFYEALGFLAQGSPFVEAGIEHVRMVYNPPAGLV